MTAASGVMIAALMVASRDEVDTTTSRKEVTTMNENSKAASGYVIIKTPGKRPLLPILHPVLPCEVYVTRDEIFRLAAELEANPDAVIVLGGEDHDEQ
jgi:hypothetical protein